MIFFFTKLHIIEGIKPLLENSRPWPILSVEYSYDSRHDTYASISDLRTLYTSRKVKQKLTFCVSLRSLVKRNLMYKLSVSQNLRKFCTYAV